VLGGLLALAFVAFWLWKVGGVAGGAFSSYLENRGKPPINIAPAASRPDTNGTAR